MYFDFQFRCSKRCSVSIAALAVHVPVATSIPNFRTGRTSFGCPTSAFRTRPRSSITLYSTVGIHAVIIKKSICVYMWSAAGFSATPSSVRDRGGMRVTGGDAPRPSECG